MTLLTVSKLTFGRGSNSLAAARTMSAFASRYPQEGEEPQARSEL
jgi:hypothetical protein